MAGLFKDDPGHTSLMRVLVLPSAVTGIGTVIAGVVGMFKSLPDAAVAMSIGAAIIGASLGMKGLQKKFENGHAQ
jgi:hypothetical protein